MPRNPLKAKQTFWRNILTPSASLKNELSKKPGLKQASLFITTAVITSNSIGIKDFHIQYSHEASVVDWTLGSLKIHTFYSSVYISLQDTERCRDFTQQLWCWASKKMVYSDSEETGRHQNTLHYILALPNSSQSIVRMLSTHHNC
jgi:hypothetical protein